MGRAPGNRHIFVSYSHNPQDIPFTLRLVDDLRAVGRVVWIDVDDRNSAPFAANIRQALIACYAYIIILSPDSSNSNWVSNELSFVVERKSAKIYPIMFRKTQRPLEIQNLRYEDFQGDYESAFSRLVRRLPNPPEIRRDRLQHIIKLLESDYDLTRQRARDTLIKVANNRRIELDAASKQELETIRLGSRHPDSQNLAKDVLLAFATHLVEEIRDQVRAKRYDLAQPKWVSLSQEYPYHPEIKNLHAEIESGKLYVQGRAQFDSGNCERAAELFEEVIRLRPDHIEAQKLLTKARSCLRQKKLVEEIDQFIEGQDWRSARRTLTTLSRENPNHSDLGELKKQLDIGEWFQRGQIFFQTEQWENAVIWFKKAVELAPNFSEAEEFHKKTTSYILQKSLVEEVDRQIDGKNWESARKIFKVLLEENRTHPYPRPGLNLYELHKRIESGERYQKIARCALILAVIAIGVTLIVIFVPMILKSFGPFPASILPTSTPTMTSTITPTATTPPIITLTLPAPTPTESPEVLPRIVFYSNRDGNCEIYIMNPDGTEQRRLTFDNNDLHIDEDPVWSPDGSRIAFHSSRGYDGLSADCYAFGCDWGIHLMNVDNLEIIPLPDIWGQDRRPDWSPDGTRIAFDSSRNDDYRDPVYCGDYCDRDVFIMDIATGATTQLTHNEASDWQPDWDPDGRRMVFVSNRNGDEDIFVMDANLPEPGERVFLTQLTHDLSSDIQPAWSPDGNWIAFASNRDGDYDIYEMAADGSAIIQLTDNEANDWQPTWSPESNQIAFSSNRDGDYDIYVMAATIDSEAIQLTDNETDDYAPDWWAQ